MNLSKLGDNNEYYSEQFWDRQARIYRTAYVNIALLLSNILVFIYTLSAGDSVFNKFGADTIDILYSGEYYRLFTSMFLHFSTEHLFNNMLCLLILGATVEHDLGHIPYLIMYLLSGLAGNVLTVAWETFTQEYALSAGASGAVFGVTGAVAVIIFCGRKKLKVAGSTVIPRLIAIIALDIYSGYADKTVNNAAHVGGLIGGIIITILITLIGRKKYTMEEWV